MPIRWDLREQAALWRYTFKWLLLTAPVGLVTGSACALFLIALDWATATRWTHPWLLFLLPLAGVAMTLLYHFLGKNTDAGNNLIMDQIHTSGMAGGQRGGVPRRMAPLVLAATVATHLFGGSAGREGTAVQMGGAIASGFARAFRLHARDIRILLMVGIAAGFGGVFGTPLAGAVFAMEVLSIGTLSYEAILPCLMGALLGDFACTAWGVHHTDYHQRLTTLLPRFDPLLMGKVALAAVAFGLASTLFAELTYGLAWLFKKSAKPFFLRPVAGGVLLIALTWLLGTRDYLGLGVSGPAAEPQAVTILSAFHPGGALPWSWFWKTLFTAITLSSGFKGGEVTPLFFVGATLGNSLAWAFNAPVDLFAGIGFVAVFAGATNTPLACTIMGIELFGAPPTLYLATGCFVAYLFSGHSGIYLSQRIGTPKIGAATGTLRSIRETRPTIFRFWRR